MFLDDEFSCDIGQGFDDDSSSIVSAGISSLIFLEFTG